MSVIEQMAAQGMQDVDDEVSDTEDPDLLVSLHRTLLTLTVHCNTIYSKEPNLLVSFHRYIRLSFVSSP